MTRGGQVVVEFVDYDNEQIYPKDKWQQYTSIRMLAPNADHVQSNDWWEIGWTR